MKFILTILFATGLVLGAWWALPPRAAVVSAATVSWELADLRELGELRLLATEIASYQKVTTVDPDRWLKAVIPVRIILGMDLTRATIARDGDAAVVTLPTVRFLHKSSDPRRWTVWDIHGLLQAKGESISMNQLAELQAFHEAESEVIRLGLPAKAQQRAALIVANWLQSLGAREVRFK